MNINPVALFKALLLAGVAAVLGSFAFQQIGRQAGKVKSSL